MVISMVSIKVSIMVSIKVRQNINKMKWMNHISALRDFLVKYLATQTGGTTVNNICEVRFTYTKIY